MSLQIEVVIADKAYPEAHIVWDMISKGRMASLEDDVQVTDGFSGKRLNFGDVSAFLLGKNADSFFFEVSSGSIEYSYVAGLDFSRLDIRGLLTSITDAENWISEILPVSCFVQARVYDHEYDLWQNMENLSYYDAEKRDHSHLPKISNGLPPPLNKEIVDVSRNPGRWVLREGFIESVGSTMWVNTEYLEVLGSNAEALTNCDFAQVTECNGTIKIQAADSCFTNAGGKEALLQDKLRALVYGVAKSPS